MTLREKVSAQEFSVATGRKPEGIREAGQRAAEAGTRFLESTVVEHEVADSAISYIINGPGGFVQKMDLTVRWDDTGDGQHRVSLEVSDFMTDRMVLWGFIPIGPKSVTAMGSLKRFAARLRKELS
jgi:hypothetical protein